MDGAWQRSPGFWANAGLDQIALVPLLPPAVVTAIERSASQAAARPPAAPNGIRVEQDSDAAYLDDNRLDADVAHLAAKGGDHETCCPGRRP